MELIGRTITGLREMTDAEMASYAWDRSRKGLVITLDDGTTLIPSADAEGNAPGVMFGEDAKGAFTLAGAGH